ncbi:hypothetical protein MW7_007565 [Imbroritus primus]|uniref:Uncharacterized protein n=1 Tax=Imbroritus primus TaxID=3058603 RepID=A0ACD3SQN5_9BURK|nr:hypothetical protein MW7_007565 [Burkholderiaceae bacterium PBA]
MLHGLQVGHVAFRRRHGHRKQRRGFAEKSIRQLGIGPAEKDQVARRQAIRCLQRCGEAVRKARHEQDIILEDQDTPVAMGDAVAPCGDVLEHQRLVRWAQPVRDEACTLGVRQVGDIMVENELKGDAVTMQFALDVGNPVGVGLDGQDVHRVYQLVDLRQLVRFLCTWNQA